MVLPVVPLVTSTTDPEPSRGEGALVALGLSPELDDKPTGPARHRHPAQPYWPLWVLAALIMLAGTALAVVWFATGQAPEVSFMSQLDRPMTAFQAPPS